MKRLESHEYKLKSYKKRQKLILILAPCDLSDKDIWRELGPFFMLLRCTPGPGLLYTDGVIQQINNVCRCFKVAYASLLNSRSAKNLSSVACPNQTPNLPGEGRFGEHCSTCTQQGNQSCKTCDGHGGNGDIDSS